MISFVLYTYICIFCKIEWKLKTTFSTKSNPLCQKTNATIYYCPGTLLDKLSVPQRNLLNDSATSPLNEHTLDSFFLQGARRASCYCCTDLIIELHYCFIRVCVEKKYIPSLIEEKMILSSCQVIEQAYAYSLWDEGRELAFFEYLSWKFGYRGTF